MVGVDWVEKGDWCLKTIGMERMENGEGQGLKNNGS